MTGYVPPGHPLIEIWLHRCGGQPCFVGTRLPADTPFGMRAQGYGDDVTKAWWPAITDEMIAASVAWCRDPDHGRVTRNALRRQRYAERRR